MRSPPTATDRERHDTVALAASSTITPAPDPAEAAFLAAVRRDGLLHEERRAWSTDAAHPPDLGALVASSRRPGAGTYVFWRSDGALHVRLAHGSVTVRAAAARLDAARELLELARHGIPPRRPRASPRR